MMQICQENNYQAAVNLMRCNIIDYKYKIGVKIVDGI